MDRHRNIPGGAPAPALARALALAALAAWPAAAAAQGISDPNASLARQALARPAAGAAAIDPVFGTTIVRLTDRTGAGGYATHLYSQLQAFSADNAYAILNEDSDIVVRRMADRSLVGGLAGIEWNAPRWQPAAPRTIVHYDSNADTTLRVEYTTVDPVATTTVFTFPSQYQRVLPNQSFDELSHDGRWMAGMAARSDGAGVIFALDLQARALGAVLPVPTLYAGPCRRDPVWGEVEPDWIGVSPLGRYLVVQWPRDGTERCSGLETFDLATGAFVGRVYDGHQHGDLGVLADGQTEFFMTFELWSPADPGQPALAYRVLPGTATVAEPVYLTSLAWGGGHISCQGPNGVCLVSYGSWDGDGWTPFEKEEFLQFTDGSVLRLAHHRSSECGYWVQPRGSLSRDGSLAIFASDWRDETGGNSCGGEPLGRGEAYLIEVPGFASCGDGDVGEGEACDDGNLESGDGCDANCTLTACGNGVVTAGEDCDDGNAVDGDCCSAACEAEPAGSDCEDGDVCNGIAVCDGAGSCTSGEALDCDDGDLCTADTCDALTGCASVDGFDAVCDEAAVASLQIRDSASPASRRLVWNWKGAAAGDFEDPVAGAEYALCVWDTAGGAAERVVSLALPPGDAWRARGARGFSYSDASASAGGVSKALVKSSASGRAKAKLVAGGAELALPGAFDASSYLAMDPSVVAQLRTRSGACWRSEWSAATINDARGFKAKAR